MLLKLVAAYDGAADLCDYFLGSLTGEYHEIKVATKVSIFPVEVLYLPGR